MNEKHGSRLLRIFFFNNITLKIAKVFQLVFAVWSAARTNKPTTEIACATFILRCTYNLLVVHYFWSGKNTSMLLAFTATRRLDESIWSGFSKHFPSVRPPRQTMCHVTSSTKTFQLTIKQSAGSLVDWFNYVKLWRNVSLEWNKVQTARPLIVTMVIHRFYFSYLFILYGIMWR